MTSPLKIGAIFILILALSMFAACASVSPPASTPTTALSQAWVPTQTAGLRLTPGPALTPTLKGADATASPTPLPPTITPTPPTLGIFEPTRLPTGVQPQVYVPSTCQYLAARWDPAASQPGTIVVPVMIHSIARPDRTISDDTTISADYFARFMEKAYQLGFQTINTAQLVDFLTRNAAIPPRSLILIVDDRKRAEFFTTYFEPYQKKYGWTVVNAWISNPDTPAYLWKENEDLLPLGLVDFQAHGVVHNVPIEPDSTDAFIHTELFGPLDVMQQHFGKRPIAYIWPRGLFTPKAVQVARSAGYQAGFTTLPRGPLMFNWIPLGKDEQAANDPLMVLPRYWDTNIIVELDNAVKIAAAAQDYAAKVKASEQAYLESYCR